MMKKLIQRFNQWRIQRELRSGVGALVREMAAKQGYRLSSKSTLKCIVFEKPGWPDIHYC